jgi:geranylgeranyl diphosphate synthase type II
MKAFDYDANPKTVAKALKVLATKAGIYGMIGGQTVDVEAEAGNQIMNEETLMFIHKNKTAALIESSMMIGAILAGASDTDVLAVEKIAYNIGIAFQIQDDILDVIGNEEVLGKPIGSDAKNEKLTYVSLKGLEEAKKDVEKLSQEAILSIKQYEKHENFLSELATYLIDREK